MHQQVGQDPSSYSLPYTFPAAGSYMLFDEFAVSGRADETHALPLQVGASGREAPALRPTSLDTTAAGLGLHTHAPGCAAHGRVHGIHGPWPSQDILPDNLAPWRRARPCRRQSDEAASFFEQRAPSSEPNRRMHGMASAAGDVAAPARQFQPDVTFTAPCRNELYSSRSSLPTPARL